MTCQRMEPVLSECHGRQNGGRQRKPGRQPRRIAKQPSSAFDDASTFEACVRSEHRPAAFEYLDGWSGWAVAGKILAEGATTPGTILRSRNGVRRVRRGKALVLAKGKWGSSFTRKDQPSPGRPRFHPSPQPGPGRMQQCGFIGGGACSKPDEHLPVSALGPGDQVWCGVCSGMHFALCIMSGQCLGKSRAISSRRSWAGQVIPPPAAARAEASHAASQPEVTENGNAGIQPIAEGEFGD
jgi:hypothetical protein